MQCLLEAEFNCRRYGIIGEDFYDENEGKYTAIRIVAGLMLFIIGVYNLYEYMVVP